METNAGDTNGAVLNPFSHPHHRRLIMALSVFFTLMVSLHLHGWSFSVWHDVIDGSKKSEVLAGHARPIRSDDWVLDLPMILAQVNHSPSFPIVNKNIAEGQNMVAPIQVPTRDVTLIFRPFTWGFFLGPDIGLSFLWWSLSLGLLYAFFLVFMIVSRGHFFASLLGSIFLLYSPYFQFWSLHKAQIAIYWGVCFVAFCYLLTAQKRKTIWISGVVLGWGAGGMALGHIYPPIAISMAWLFPFAFGAFLWDRKIRPAWTVFRRDRIAALGLALILVFAALANLIIQMGPTFELIRNTTYPGKRFSLGGGFPLWAFFSHNLFAIIKGSGTWIGNICEASSFIYIFPFIVFVVIGHALLSKRFLDRWSLPLFGYIIFISIYSYIGIPEWFARISMLGQSTSNRTQMGLGVANAIILVSAFTKSTDFLKTRMGLRAGAIGVWFLILLGFGFWMRQNWPNLKMSQIGIMAFANAFLAFLWFIKGWKNVFIGGLVATSFAYSFLFNPLVRGGTEFIFHNPLSEKILALDPTKQAKWVVMGDLPLSNLLRMLGVKSLGGYHSHPHLRLWEKFDPSGKFFREYNQCAFITFQGSESMEAKFQSPSSGVVDVFVHPLSDVFQKAGVQYFIAVGEKTIALFQGRGRFKKLFEFGTKAIFQRG